MHLQRVQVPDFRVLKDIDISFEKEFSPRIFPLGSLNGGGKSTLLQLIFILLHCSADPKKHEFIRNLLEGFAIPEGSNQRVVAEFEIWDGKKTVNINVFVYRGTEVSPESITGKIIDLYEPTSGKIVATLLFKFTNIDDEIINQFHRSLSNKIFLASPSTQIFLFLSKEYRKSRFKSNKTLENQEESSKKQDMGWEWDYAKKELTTFFPYDFVSVDVLIQSFKKARDKDFEQAIETGHYGNHYQNLLNDFNEFLKDKKVNLDKDLSGVNFKAERNGEIIELYPEDLSHGELKRLSLYVWLKYSNIENAIILFDEIEIALHPDWQYQIIRDLEEWGPTNQYILATHSYELCQALTPAHVKEIEPKLLNKINN